MRELAQRLEPLRDGGSSLGLALGERGGGEDEVEEALLRLARLTHRVLGAEVELVPNGAADESGRGVAVDEALREQAAGEDHVVVRVVRRGAHVDEVRVVVGDAIEAPARDELVGEVRVELRVLRGEGERAHDAQGHERVRAVVGAGQVEAVDRVLVEVRVVREAAVGVVELEVVAVGAHEAQRAAQVRRVFPQPGLELPGHRGVVLQHLEGGAEGHRPADHHVAAQRVFPDELRQRPRGISAPRAVVLVGGQRKSCAVEERRGGERLARGEIHPQQRARHHAGDATDARGCVERLETAHQLAPRCVDLSAFGAEIAEHAVAVCVCGDADSTVEPGGLVPRTDGSGAAAGGGLEVVALVCCEELLDGCARAGVGGVHAELGGEPGGEGVDRVELAIVLPRGLGERGVEAVLARAGDERSQGVGVRAAQWRS